MEKETKFTCSNCGFCCLDPSTLINMTLLDIKWLSIYTKMSVKELFLKEIVTFIPFLKNENFSEFEVEFGMKRPCPVYKNNRCEIYNARPMNCRIFPYSYITNRVEDIVECIKNVSPDPKTFIIYRMYERMIGEILLKQDEMTSEFLKKIGATQTINVSNESEYKKFTHIIKKKGWEKEDNALKSSQKLMKIADGKVDKKRLYKKLDLIEKEIDKINFDKEIEILINAESILDGEITNIDFKY